MDGRPLQYGKPNSELCSNTCMNFSLKTSVLWIGTQYILYTLKPDHIETLHKISLFISI